MPVSLTNKAAAHADSPVSPGSSVGERSSTDGPQSRDRRSAEDQWSLADLSWERQSSDGSRSQSSPTDQRRPSSRTSLESESTSARCAADRDRDRDRRRSSGQSGRSAAVRPRDNLRVEGEFQGRRADSLVVTRGERAAVVRHDDNLRVGGQLFAGTAGHLCSCWPRRPRAVRL